MRRYLLIMTLGWMLPLVAFVGINWLVDPYRIFHKPWVRDNYYATDHTMRDAAAGIINTEDFDSIILGSSMATNFSANEASTLFAQRFVNLSMDGSGIPERSLVLAYALKKQPLTTVIFSFDWDSLRSRIEQAPIAPYTYLYDDNPVNDLLIYGTSPKVLRYALCRNRFISSDLLCRNSKNDLEYLVEWHSNWEHSKRFGGLNKWLEANNDKQIKDALQEIASSIHAVETGAVSAADLDSVQRAVARDRKVFEDRVIRIAESNPRTRFYLFIPPYSRLNYAILKQSNPQRFAEYISILREVVNESSRLPNVKVFGFEDEDFLDDIANYKDTSHYHQRFNSAMLHWMKNGEHELTPENLEPYIETITKRAENYPLREIGTQIDAYLRSTSEPKLP